MNKDRRTYYCIETMDHLRIYIGPHWETKPSLNQPLCFNTESEAEDFIQKWLPHYAKYWICEANWFPNNPRIFGKDYVH